MGDRVQLCDTIDLYTTWVRQVCKMTSKRMDVMLRFHEKD